MKTSDQNRNSVCDKTDSPQSTYAEFRQFGAPHVKINDLCDNFGKMAQNLTDFRASIAKETIEKLWDRKQKHQKMEEIFSAGLSNLHSICAEERFIREKNF